MLTCLYAALSCPLSLFVDLKTFAGSSRVSPTLADLCLFSHLDLLNVHMNLQSFTYLLKHLSIFCLPFWCILQLAFLHTKKTYVCLPSISLQQLLDTLICCFGWSLVDFTLHLLLSDSALFSSLSLTSFPFCSLSNGVMSLMMPFALIWPQWLTGRKTPSYLLFWCQLIYMLPLHAHLMSLMTWQRWLPVGCSLESSVASVSRSDLALSTKLLDRLNPFVARGSYTVRQPAPLLRTFGEKWV